MMLHVESTQCCIVQQTADLKKGWEHRGSMRDCQGQTLRPAFCHWRIAGWQVGCNKGNKHAPPMYNLAQSCRKTVGISAPVIWRAFT